jgi:hypothetical protein
MQDFPKPLRQWYCVIKVDGRKVLEITAPLVVVIEAMSRTLSSVDYLLFDSSIVETKLDPA